MMLRTAFASLVLAGCIIQTPPPTGPAAQNECAAVANNASMVIASDRSPDVRGNLEAVVGRRCVEDGWSAEMRACVLNAHDPDTMHGCADQLLDVQQKARAMAAAQQVLGEMQQEEDTTMQKPPEGPDGIEDQQGSLPRGSQAEIAEHSDEEGRALMNARRYGEASAKFRDAVARVPEARYFYDLCVSLGAEDRREEATTACNAALKVGANAALKQKVEAELDLLSH